MMLDRYEIAAILLVSQLGGILGAKVIPMYTSSPEEWMVAMVVVGTIVGVISGRTLARVFGGETDG